MCLKFHNLRLSLLGAMLAVAMGAVADLQPPITVKGGKSAFYSIDVGKGE